MKVVVCAKQIPDPSTPYQLEEGTGWLIPTRTIRCSTTPTATASKWGSRSLKPTRAR